MLDLICATLLFTPCYTESNGFDDMSQVQTNVAVRKAETASSTALSCEEYTDPSMFEFFPGKTKFPWPGPYDNGNRREVPRVKASDLSYDRFFQEYVLPNKMVIIEGATQNIFKDAPDAWTPTALAQAPFSELLQPVVKKSGRVVDVEAYLSLPQVFAQVDKTIMFNKSLFGELLSSSAEHIPLSNLLFQRQFLLKMKNDSFLNFNGTHFDSLDSSFNLHVSHQGGSLPHSHAPTMNMLFHGSKRWIMVDPMEYPDADARYRFEKMDVWKEAAIGEHPQKWFAQEAKDMLDTLKIPYYDFVLSVGEGVYIPNMWMHGTEDLCRDTVGVELRGLLVEGGYRACWTQALENTYTPPDFKFGYPHVDCDAVWLSGSAMTK